MLNWALQKFKLLLKIFSFYNRRNFLWNIKSNFFFVDLFFSHQKNCFYPVHWLLMKCGYLFLTLTFEEKLRILSFFSLLKCYFISFYFVFLSKYDFHFYLFTLSCIKMLFFLSIKFNLDLVIFWYLDACFLLNHLIRHKSINLLLTE